MCRSKTCILTPFLIMILCGLAWLTTADPAGAADAKSRGAQIYAKLCASCHGKTGRGVKGEYSKPLMGEMYVPQLTRYIQKEMPEDKPEQCSGEDAKQVAQYIYDAFYSPVAAARHRPPRIELSRLTVRQYRNALADLIGSFRPTSQIDDQRGLKGEYYKSRAIGRNRIIQRIDPQIRFDLGPKFDQRAKFDPKGFSVRWTGSLLPHETGRYEFVIRTDQSMRFWVNDPRNPKIDAYVRSGKKNEHRASMFLVGGRAYPIALEFSSYRQGVGNSDKRKGDVKIVPAFIEMHWKLPNGTEQLIPARHLSPKPAQKVYVADTPFPPDDSSVGYVRGSSISKAWDDATTQAAITAAGYVAENIRELTGARFTDGDAKKKLIDFCAKFTERAFRRPLNNDQRKLYIERQFAEAPNLESAIKRVVIMTLKSPRFLYSGGGDKNPDAYGIASRLSFALWDSLPDRKLLDAAKSGKLKTRKQIADQAQRMINDSRTRAKIRQFLYHWLEIEHVTEVAKDPKRYPEFDPQLALDLRASLDMFLDDVVWGDQSDFRQLLVSDELYVNGRLAKYYGMNLPADAPFKKLKVAKGQRAGVLTHPYLMARFAYLDGSSPIHRGVFVVRSVLGRTLRPPPMAIAPTDADLNPKMTTRQRFAAQTQARTCQSCHRMINSLGFALEHYDAVGRFRKKEKNQPIDASGFYESATGKKWSFNGAAEMAGFLAKSEQTHGAFVLQLFHHLVKQPIYAYGPKTPATLRQAFVNHKFNIRKLMVDIAVTSAMPDSGKSAAADDPRRHALTRKE